MLLRSRIFVSARSVGSFEIHSGIANRVFKPLMLKWGIVDGEGAPRFLPHAMRNAAASLFIEQGWPSKQVQTMLGHSSITMTFDVYEHLCHDPAAVRVRGFVAKAEPDEIVEPRGEC